MIYSQKLLEIFTDQIKIPKSEYTQHQKKFNNFCVLESTFLFDNRAVPNHQKYQKVYKQKKKTA